MMCRFVPAFQGPERTQRPMTLYVCTLYFFASHPTTNAVSRFRRGVFVKFHTLYPCYCISLFYAIDAGVVTE